MPQLIPMSDRRRELIFKVQDDQLDALPLIHYMTQYSRCDQMLDWLIRNKITGRNFVFWARSTWNNSLMGMVKHIIGKIDRNENEVSLFARDLLSL